MPSLGLGLTIPKQPFISNLTKLENSSTMLLDANRADGFLPGVNAPPTNPIVDLANVLGKNLFNGLLLNDTRWNTSSMSTSALVGYKANATPIGVNENTNYFLSIDGVNLFADNIRFYTATGTYISEVYSGGAFTTPQNCKYVCFYALDAKFTNSNVQLELGSTATSYEPYNRNDLSLVNLAYTTASGYDTLVAPNGRTITAVKLDGVDDYGILPNSADLDPTGLDDFGMAFVIKTGASIGFSTLISKRLDNNDLNSQYTIRLTPDFKIQAVLVGNYPTSTAIITTNNFFKIFVIRKNNILKFIVNGNVVYNAQNTISLVSHPNTRMFARSNNIDGTSHTDFFNGYFITTDFTLSPSDKWESDFNRYCQQQYGL